MEITLPLDQMSIEEKLRVMESLWADLTRAETQYPSPEWHNRVLREREQRVESGEEKPIDWEGGKKEIRADEAGH